MFLPIKLLRRTQSSLLVTLGKWLGPSIYAIALLIPGVGRLETDTYSGQRQQWRAQEEYNKDGTMAARGYVAATDREVARRDSRFPSKRQETIGMIQSVHRSEIGHLGWTLSRTTSVAFPHLVSHNPLWPHRLDIKETLQ
ncbi:predicted protein [Postia placenta Mad-698-R]|uniref:Uncharacterized protein n=1 Tax=Postia placenta MAD-698-R-SB12 TaxID=670580 RepID=A0A1X6MTJ6_9APHY|nr:hypothetical protein POSPLADRAFT_1149045 [Postia placenta MAD-698-R-SB12]EED79445.1 predicted protein [Postia placenta Mad-698-R]OSX59649.1 hypothetical protein POSPLADRAFT_1149045 [Postia placenta MAD-698-R-SB12]